MNTRILLLLSAVAGFSSCATVYKTGQTPDDVYFSPARPESEYVRTDTRRDRDKYNYNRDAYLEDSRLRMTVLNRQRWSYLYDDWYYNDYYYNRNMCLYNTYYYNPYNFYYYNPYNNPFYYTRPVIIVPDTRSKGLRFSSALRSFTANNTNTFSMKGFSTSGTSTRSGGTRYFSSQKSSGNRSSGRRIFNLFGNSSSSSDRSYGNSSGSSSAPSRSSSSSSSSSGSKAPVRKF